MACVSFRQQLGDEIGRGGFGTVYKGLNTKTGDFVAVKSVSLRNVGTSELGPLQTEIQLLRTLNHPNIVKYIDSLRSDGYLHIVLEYVENGSLAQTIKRFGPFSESLCAIYVSQVLQGLEYLHEQGVVHRDIKGANILTTKKGLVKLADFGVAMSDSEKSNSVVGTPYWMAPEIIEMAGPTSACDIWSVGCTVIELLTGKPPYFDLRPMTALFRIVQDDYPPLPEHISPALREFLIECFKKEPSFRKTAAQLLQHPWITKQGAKAAKAAQAAKPAIPTAEPPAAKPSRASDAVGRAGDGKAEAAAVTDVEREAFEHSVRMTIRLYNEARAAAGLQPAGAKSAESKSGSPDKAVPTGSDDDSDEDWDAGLDMANTPPRGLMALPGSGAGESSTAVPGPAIAARPPPVPGTGARPVGSDILGRERSGGVDGDDDEDFMAGWDDSDDDDEDDGGRVVTSSSLVGRSKKPAAALNMFVETEEDDGWGDFDLGDASSGGGVAELGARLKKTKQTRGKEAEETERDMFGDGDLDDDRVELDAKSRLEAQVRRLLARLANPSGASPSYSSVYPQGGVEGGVVEWNESSMLDTCDELLGMFRDNPSHQRDLGSLGVLPILDILSAATSNSTATATASGKAQAPPRIVAAVLKVVNVFASKDRRLQEALALVGVLPTVLSFSNAEHADTIRVQAARFVQSVCNSSDTALQLFVACGGVEVLTGLLEATRVRAAPVAAGTGSTGKRLSEEADVDDAEAFLRSVAVHGVARVFSLHSVTRNEFCRLFVKAQLVPRLMSALNSVLRPVWRAGHGSAEQGDSEATKAYADASCIVDLLVLFSHGDTLVKSAMALPEVAASMMRVLRPPLSSLWNDARYATLVVGVLKATKNMSMEPATLDVFHYAGAIPTMVPILAKTVDPAASRVPHGNDMRNHVMHALYYLCRVNRSRQEAAAVAGLIPLLQEVVTSPSALKQFAVSILCDMSRASRRSRNLLWDADGVNSYVMMLSQNYWQIHAISAISDWLAADTMRVEAVLLMPESVLALQALFQTASKGAVFESVLSPLVSMCERSAPLAQALSHCGLFVVEVVHRLRSNNAAIVLKSLLRLLRSLFTRHSRQLNFMQEFSVYPVVAHLASTSTDRLKLVQSIARGLLSEFDGVLAAELD